LAAVCRLPCGVEIEDAGDRALLDAVKTIPVALVEGARGIDCQVAFEVEQAQKQTGVDGGP